MPLDDYEGTVKGVFPPGVDMSWYSTVARYPHMDSALRAIERVRAIGVGRGDVALLGAERDLVKPGVGVSDPDAQVLASVVRTGFLYAAVGALTGIFLGLALLLFPAFRSTTGARLDAAAAGAATVVGAVVGSIGSWFTGVVTGLGLRMSGMGTYGDQIATGPALVGVRADASHDRSAVNALRSAGALSVRHIDSASGQSG